MAMDFNNYELIGKKTIFIDGFQFTPEYVSSEAGELTIEESTVEIASQSGTINYPTGTFSNLSVTLNLLIPSIRILQYIWPDIWTPASFGYDDDGKVDFDRPSMYSGQIRFGAEECKTPTARRVVIHHACAENSRNDIQIPNAIISNAASFSLDSLQELAITIAPLPGTEGAIILGEGSLENATLYDPETMEYKVVSGS